MSALPAAVADDLLLDAVRDDHLLLDGVPTAAPSHIAPTDARVIPLNRPRRRITESVPAPSAVTPGDPAGVPCAARPSTGFRHLDGPCQCFFGGPAPVFPAAIDPAAHA